MRSPFVIAIALAVTGCATAPSRPVAAILADELTQYEAQIDAKIAAEQEFYKKVESDLIRDAESGVQLDREVTRQANIERFVDEVMAPSVGFSPTKLRDMLEATGAADREAFEALDTKIAKAQQAARLSVTELAVKRNALTKTRDSLVNLARDPSVRERLSRMIDFAKAVKTETDKAKNKEAMVAPTPMMGQ